MAGNFEGRFVLNNVRITFPKIFDGQQEAFQGKGDPYFSSSFLMEKTHPQLEALKAKIREAAQSKWPTDWEAQLRGFFAKDKLVLHDGDLKATKPYGAAYAGKYYVSARNNAKTGPAPGVFDSIIDPATKEARIIKSPSDPKAPYSGCYVNAIISLFPYDMGGGQGVGASILGIQFREHGERLAGGGVASADDFEAVPGTEAAMPGGAATAPAAGAQSLF